jgi:hypothetical protein
VATGVRQQGGSSAHQPPHADAEWAEFIEKFRFMGGSPV